MIRNQLFAIMICVLGARLAFSQGLPYDEHDQKSIGTFLEAVNTAEEKNGPKINKGYLAFEPNTWKGVTWKLHKNVKRVSKIFWKEAKLGGTLDLSGCTELTDVSIVEPSYYSRYYIREINLKGCKSLKTLQLKNTHIKNLDISESPEIFQLDVSGTWISNLNLSKQSNLRELYFSRGNLDSVILPAHAKLKLFINSGSNPFYLVSPNGKIIMPLLPKGSPAPEKLPFIVSNGYTMIPFTSEESPLEMTDSIIAITSRNILYKNAKLAFLEKQYLDAWQMINDALVEDEKCETSDNEFKEQSSALVKNLHKAMLKESAAQIRIAQKLYTARKYDDSYQYALKAYQLYPEYRKPLPIINALETIEKRLDSPYNYAKIGVKVNLNGRDCNNNSVSQGKYNGNFVLLDFWTSWCGYCLREIPDNIKLYEKYKDKGFQVLGVNCDNDNDNAKECISKYSIPWTNLSANQTAEVLENKISRYANGYPTMLLLDSYGRIVHLHARGATLEKLLKEIYDKSDKQEKATPTKTRQDDQP